MTTTNTTDTTEHAPCTNCHVPPIPTPTQTDLDRYTAHKNRPYPIAAWARNHHHPATGLFIGRILQHGTDYMRDYVEDRFSKPCDKARARNRLALVLDMLTDAETKQLIAPGWGDGTLSVRLELVVEVNPKAWAAAYGVAEDSIGQDVKEYIAGGLHGAPDAPIRVVSWS